MRFFNIDNEIISNRKIVTTNPTFFLRGYQFFGIVIRSIERKVIDDEGFEHIIEYTDEDILNQPERIYSAKEVPNSEPVVADAKMFAASENFCYTLYIPEVNTTVRLIVFNDSGEIDEYIISRVADTNPEKERLYQDLITNYNLPKFEELSECMIDTRLRDSDYKLDLLKRLLLDFRNISKYLGTKTSIKKFFDFIGLHNIKLEDVLKKSKYTDDLVKTGMYNMLWNNFETDSDQKLTTENLPNRLLVVENIEDLFDKLPKIIACCNRYFTVPEQDIVYFGVSFSSNIPVWKSVTSTFQQIQHIDTTAFRHDMKLNICWREFDSKDSYIHNVRYIVEGAKQTKLDCISSEVKFVITEEQATNISNPELYWVDKPILSEADTQEAVTNIETFRRDFGVIPFLELYTKERLYIKLTVTHIESGSEIVGEYVTENFGHTARKPNIIPWFSALDNDYNIKVELRDDFNNREVYTYKYRLKDDVSGLDIITFTSNNGLYSDEELNRLTLESTSPTVVTDVSNHHTLKDFIEPTLENYFKDSSTVNIYNYMLSTDVQTELIPDIPYNTILKDVCDIPLRHIHNWSEWLAIPIKQIEDAGYDLNNLFATTLFDFRTSTNHDFKLTELIDYLKTETDNLWNIFALPFEVINQETLEVEKYLLVGSVETGAQIKHFLFEKDFETVNKENSLERFVFERLSEVVPFEANKTNTKHIPNVQNNRLPAYLIEKSVKERQLNNRMPAKVLDCWDFKFPVSYDFDINRLDKHIQSDDLTQYDKFLKIPEENRVKSIYPRLKPLQNIEHKIGDMTLFTPNRDIILYDKDFSWSLQDNYDLDEEDVIVKESRMESLLYRCDRKTVFNLQYTLLKRGKKLAFFNKRGSILVR